MPKVIERTKSTGLIQPDQECLLKNVCCGSSLVLCEMVGCKTSLHPLAAVHTGLDAGATHGNIAKVVHADGRPSMLLTTASVHSGASGGALVSRQGKLLGL
eukprot:scaffold16366_cov17-Tisochrysis_lutea.AAC.1